MSRQDGISIHADLFTFESLSAGFQRLGLSPRIAENAALYTTLRLKNYSPEDAKSAIERIMPRRQNNGQ